MVLSFLTVFVTGLFAGAALYVTLVEHRCGGGKGGALAGWESRDGSWVER